MSADQDPKWLQWRREGITASDVAQAVTGTYGTAYTVIDEKLRPTPREQRDEWDRGHAAERPMAEALEALTGYHVVDEQLWAEHPDHPEYRATVDGGLATTPGGTAIANWEAKTVSPGAHTSWPYWRAQANWQMYVRQLPLTIFTVANYRNVLTVDPATGRDRETETLSGFRMVVVHADPELQEVLVDTANRLYGYLTSRTLPPVDGSPFVKERLARRFAIADRDADMVDLTEQADDFDLNTLIARRKELRQQAKAVADQIGSIDNWLKNALGEATSGTTGEYRVSWPARRTVDFEALAADYPLQYGLALRPTPQIDALEAALGKSVVDRYRTPTGRAGLTITEEKQ